MDVQASESMAAVSALLAFAQAQLGEREAARVSIADAESVQNEADADTRCDLAAAYLALFELDKGETLLQTVIAEQPRHSLALTRLGFLALNRNQPEQAIDYFERSLQNDADSLSVYAALLGLYLQRANYTATANLLNTAWARFQAQQPHLPADYAARIELGLQAIQLRVWVAQEQFAEAEEWLKQRAEQADINTYAASIILYAQALAETDRHDQAQETIREALKNYPDYAPLIVQLAELADLKGQSAYAVHLLDRAIRKDEQNPELWIKLANVCGRRFEERALKAAEKALAIFDETVPSDDHPEWQIKAFALQAKTALAEAKANQQAYEEAEALFNEVLAEQPKLLPALRGLGGLLMQQGRIAAAIECFEQVRQIDPVSGYSALINARQFPEDVETLERMEQAARRPSLEGRLRSSIFFQLASAWEKRKEYDKAFACADEANQASRKFLRYDPVEHRQNCARLRAIYSKAFFDRRKDFGNPSSTPVYVLGMPRSGTTLVEQILAGHSQIQGAGELGVIGQRIQGLNRWEREIGSGRSYPLCIDDMTAYVSKGIADGVLEELNELKADAKPEAHYVVDKLPHNFENIGFIKLLFPNAKIISVRRDPRDIAISNYFTDYAAKHGGMGFAYDQTWIGEQLADHNLLMQHWAQVFPGEILEVNYEDVVEDTEGSARKMLDYIGVDWEPQVLAFNELDRPVKTASVWQVRQPIYKTSKAKWMRYQGHISPLVKAANAPIRPEAETLKGLPVPGLYTDAGAFYKAGKLDEAEYEYKKVLHHLPEHGAANFMVGVIYHLKGHPKLAIEQMEKGLEVCPWNRQWRDYLVRVCEQIGDAERAARWRRVGTTDELDEEGYEGRAEGCVEQGAAQQRAAKSDAAVTHNTSDGPAAPDATSPESQGFGRPKRRSSLDDLFTSAGSTLADPIRLSP